MKLCIVETTEANLATIKRCLPHNVGVAGELKPFDSDIVSLKLEGDALPPWCHVVAGCRFPRGVATVLPGGELQITPGTGMTVEQVPPEELEKT